MRWRDQPLTRWSFIAQAHGARMNWLQSLLQGRLLLQAYSLGSLSDRLLLDLHGIERSLHILVPLDAVVPLATLVVPGLA